MSEWRVLVGDVRDRLTDIASDSVDLCVTSPPYWGAQRDYRHAQQIGMERTPELFVEQLVSVFRDVRRVMSPAGTLWLNIGDSYAASGKGGGGRLMAKRGGAWGHRERMRGWRSAPPGYKQKDLVGVPWLLAFALRADGWYLRRDVIWEKSQATEPTRADRPVVQHEMLFQMTKSRRYFYALPERQEGTVWRFASDGSQDGHQATMPNALAERCIERSSRPGGLVMDPFCGRGTTGKAAVRLGRSFIGIELNEDFAALSRVVIGNASPLFSTEQTA